MKKLFSIVWKLQTHYHFKLDFQKVDQRKGGKWLIHGTITCMYIRYNITDSSRYTNIYSYDILVMSSGSPLTHWGRETHIYMRQ